MQRIEVWLVLRRFLSLGFVFLLCLPFTAHGAGLKKVVAVQDFTNKAAQSQWNTGEEFDLGTAMAEQLTDALVQSGQFVVLERLKLDSVMDEQDMAASGRFQKSKSAQMGKLTSAQVLVQGVITELEVQANQGGSSIGFSGIRLGKDSQEVHIGLIVRLFDTTTGEVIDSQRVEGVAKQTGTKMGLNVGGLKLGSKNQSATPLGEAIQLAVDNAVEYIAERLRNLPFQGRVIKVSGDTIFISAGENNSVSNGDVFRVFSVGEELVDPVTGELLGSDEELIGRAKVFSVKEKYSKAKLKGGGSVKVGDMIRDEFE